MSKLAQRMHLMYFSVSELKMCVCLLYNNAIEIPISHAYKSPLANVRINRVSHGFRVTVFICHVIEFYAGLMGVIVA